MHSDEREYCARCGGRLEPREGVPHRLCLACGEINYRNPAVGVAVVLLQGDSILLGRRNRGPWSGLWCIPCGYLEWDEDVRDGARREMKEETGLDVELIELFHAYSDPKRDTRKHTISTVFIGRASGTPTGGDDAARCLVCTPEELPARLVSDHALMVSDYQTYKRTGKRPPPKR